MAEPGIRTIAIYIVIRIVFLDICPILRNREKDYKLDNVVVPIRLNT